MESDRVEGVMNLSLGRVMSNSDQQQIRDPDMFELEEHKVEPILVKLKNSCFHKKVPIIVGQKGNCYKILRHFDQGSFGMMFYGIKIDSNFEIQRDVA